MMLFFTFLSAFLIEGIGTWVSVIGLSSLFAGDPVVIILAVALDIGKITTVSFLYKQWKNINLLMRTYMTIASIVLMIITSSGAFGFLSQKFQKAIAATNQDSIVLTSLTDEQGRLQKRKEEIDAQIAKLPDNNVRGRTQLMRQFGPEVGRINKRLEEIDKQLPDLKVASIKKDVEVGPIIYIAQAFNTDPEHAVKWVILTIIFVFDPLAIALLLAGNFLIEQRKKNVVDDLQVALDKFTPEKHGGEFPTDKDDRAISQHQSLKTASEIIGEASMNTVTNIAPPNPNPITKAQFEEMITEVPINPQDFTPKSPPPPFDTNPPPEKFGHQRYNEPLIDQLDHLQHEHLGRERYQETFADQNDHITHEHLGRQKPIDVIDSSIRPALPEEVNPEREVILLHDVMPPKLPKSSLETISDKNDVETDEDTRQWLKPLRQEYQKDTPPS